jgi:hypothetical protein
MKAGFIWHKTYSSSDPFEESKKFFWQVVQLLASHE